VNATYADLLGRAAEDLVGIAFTEVLHQDGQAGDDMELDELLRGHRGALSAEVRYVSPVGLELWVLHGVSLVMAADGGPGWFAVSAQDVTERRRAEQDLRDLTGVLAEQAVRDPLTGLANRTLVEERLRGALAHDARTGGTTGLLFLDLDGFKAVNDRHGHAVGDLVLRAVADRLTRGVRPSDTVARIGGDEFVVLAEGASPAGLPPLVDRLRAAVAEPIALGTLSLEVTVSIGFAVSAAGESDAVALFAAADAAMYAAKRGRPGGS